MKLIAQFLQYLEFNLKDNSTKYLQNLYFHCITKDFDWFNSRCLKIATGSQHNYFGNDCSIMFINMNYCQVYLDFILKRYFYDCPSFYLNEQLVVAEVIIANFKLNYFDLVDSYENKTASLNSATTDSYFN